MQQWRLCSLDFGFWEFDVQWTPLAIYNLFAAGNAVTLLSMCPWINLLSFDPD